LESNISQAEALALYVAVRNLCPKHSVEIGLAHGISALAIHAAISANGTGHHYVIDPFQANNCHCGEAMIQRSGCRDLHSLLERFPEEVLPSLPGLKFAFIDSSHLFDLTLLEFVVVDKKLEVDGIHALHDTWMPYMQAVLRFILANRAYEISRDFSPDAPELSLSERSKQLVARCLTKMPGAERLVNSNVLRPWSTFLVGNLVFLRKLANDQRDWRDHRHF
jgi:methyltransferase family protein